MYEHPEYWAELSVCVTARPRSVQTEDATGVPLARQVPERDLVAEVEQEELQPLQLPQLTVRLEPVEQPE